MYASKITIDYKPQKVRYHREVELPDGMLTLEDISKHLKDGETFGFQEREISQFGTTLFMNIHGFRDETKDELDARIAKQEKYNDNYEKHHIKYPKK
jgi:predicted component of type VI protein secretion system